LKKLLLVLAVLFSAGAILAACGGDGDDAKVTADNLATVADEACAENNRAFDELGVRGLTNPGIAAEFEGTAQVRRQFVTSFEEIDVDESVPAEWDEYVELTADIAESDEAIAAAAEKNDDAAVADAFEAQSALYDKREELAGQLGFEVCGRTPEVTIEETGTGPAGDLAFTEPENTIEEAAGEYLEAGVKGDCEAFNAERHTDAGTVDEQACELTAESLKGGEVAGTEQYGPVGVAEIVGADDVHYATYFVTDLDGDLKYAGDVINDSGGLRPATDGNDADETADAAIDALRDGDAEAFNAAISDPANSIFRQEKDGFDRIGEDEYGAPFVEDVRAGDAAPEPLGINATYAFYLVPGSEHDWVISLVHTPGLGNEYRFTGFFPVPAAD
jgi:hypothetical protein